MSPALEDEDVGVDVLHLKPAADGQRRVRPHPVHQGPQFQQEWYPQEPATRSSCTRQILQQENSPTWKSDLKANFVVRPSSDVQPSLSDECSRCLKIPQTSAAGLGMSGVCGILSKTTSTCCVITAFIASILSWCNLEDVVQQPPQRRYTSQRTNAENWLHTQTPRTGFHKKTLQMNKQTDR